jgi:flotillin
MSTLLFAGAGALGLLLLVGFMSILFRRVVSTNEVHIVQSSKSTTSYGKDTGNGNTYYEWPSWIPLIGITKIVSPVSVFDLDLTNYEAYDKGRLPFLVDVKAFFRITDTNIAAQRVSSFDELNTQLKAIVQGAVRTILAGSEIEEIMQGRSKFGEEFTKEVDGQLSNWGVQTVKTIELMDIRDSQSSNVIKNIMEKKKSYIEMESRIEVAKNKKLASVAEIEASKEVELKNQSAQQDVGMRTTEAEREVALALQQKIQVIKDQEKITKEKEMNVLSVQSVRGAEIQKEVTLVQAAQDKETKIVIAEGQKATTVLQAQGQLESKKLESEGISLEGTARAEAQKAMELAPVQAQIVLAKEIGSNGEYQKYLITIEQIKAAQSVGEKQAEALKSADIKVISNSGSPSDGLTNVMDIFSSKGGIQVGAMLEGLANTDQGQALLTKAGLTTSKTEETKKH